MYISWDRPRLCLNMGSIPNSNVKPAYIKLGFGASQLLTPRCIDGEHELPRTLGRFDLAKIQWMPTDFQSFNSCNGCMLLSISTSNPVRITTSNKR